MSGKLKREIKQTKPFNTVQEELVLTLGRVADQIVVPMNEVLRGAALSPSQYNILRILRGAGEEGLPCGEISERMVRRDPDLTRLLDRMETRGLVRRARDTKDRRVVRAWATEDAFALLATLDQPVVDSLKAALAHVPVTHQRELLRLLEELLKD